MQVRKFSELFVGLTSSFEVRINAKMVGDFCEISGDNNPLHIDEEYARDKGFDGAVVYGLLTSAFYSTLIGVHLPGRYSVMHGLTIEYIKPVYVGDTLTVSGTVSYINEAYRQVEIRSIITNQQNKRVSKAKIKVGVIDE